MIEAGDLDLGARRDRRADAAELVGSDGRLRLGGRGEESRRELPAQLRRVRGGARGTEVRRGGLASELRRIRRRRGCGEEGGVALAVQLGRVGCLRGGG